MMRIAAGLILALAVLTGLAARSAVAAPGEGPSFSCTQAAGVEALICKDAVLSGEDRRLQVFYARALPGALGNGSNQLQVQRQWLKDLHAHCAADAWSRSGAKSQLQCIVAAYDDRLKQLAVATLLSSPSDSLAEIRRTDAVAAPIDEALVDYVTIQDPAQRARTVAPLLAPAYSAIDADTRDQLRDRQETATPELAAASDAGFAHFFVVSALFGDADLTWPCAALLERPGLIEGLGAFWGGAIDGQVPGSDCSDALPTPAEVEALSQQALDAQPRCDGTIRFSTGREYEKLADAIRMHRTEVWETKAQPKLDGRGFRNAHRAKIDAADRALAAYYRKVFAVAPEAADRDARSAVNSLISSASDLCQ